MTRFIWWKIRDYNSGLKMQQGNNLPSGAARQANLSKNKKCGIYNILCPMLHIN
jgi:hypothetical protein